MSEQVEFWLHRSICGVLGDMRACYRTRNFAPLLGLIEEAQTMANRMEAALGDLKDIPLINEEWHRLKAEVKKARQELKELQDRLVEPL